MYLEACLQQDRHFSPFVASIAGILVVEASATLKRIASRLGTKWWQPYSRTCGYVTSRITITLVQATHRCIRGSRVPAHKISVHRLQWEEGARLNLFRWYSCSEIPRTSKYPTPPEPLIYIGADGISQHKNLNESTRRHLVEPT